MAGILASPYRLIWFALWAVYLFAIYSPSAVRFRRQQVTQESTRPLDIALDMTAFVCWQVLPLVWLFSGWPEFADFARPAWLGWLGALTMVAALVLLIAAYRRLGANWSPKIDLRADQQLETGGIYARIRHPIYLGMLLWAASQPLLITNFIAGGAFLPMIVLLLAIRIPREERMMRQRFGQAYERYEESTPALFPRVRRLGT